MAKDRLRIATTLIIYTITQQMAMKKRGRQERVASDTKRWLCLLFLTMRQQHQHDVTVQAMFPHHRRNAWKTENTSAKERIKVILQSRGGAINWDEPFYSDDSEAEGSTFLPSEEEEAEEDEVQRQEQPPPPPSQQRSQTQDETDDNQFDVGERESDLHVAPFLESFQREIHSIVHDYRQEVSDTFRHLKDDILDSQERYSRRYRPVPVEKHTGKYEVEEQEDFEIPKSMPKRRRKPVIEEAIEDDFIVGGTDDEEDNVLFRLKEERDPDREDVWGGLDWDVDEETEASPGNFGADVEDSWKDQTTKKRRRRKSGKKKGKESSSRYISSKENESHLNDERIPKDVGENLMDGGPSSDASLVTGGSDSSLSDSQTWKPVTVAVSVLAMAILLNIAFQILTKMLFGAIGGRS